MLIGVIAPKIVLPESFLNRLTADELQMILAHELVHWRKARHVGWLAASFRAGRVLVSPAGVVRDCADPA